MRALRNLATVLVLGFALSPAVYADDAARCAENAAGKYGVQEATLMALDRTQFGKTPATCQRYYDNAELLAAAIADAGGDQMKALKMIEEGPAGPHLRKAILAVAARTKH